MLFLLYRECGTPYGPMSVCLSHFSYGRLTAWPGVIVHSSGSPWFPLLENDLGSQCNSAICDVVRITPLECQCTSKSTPFQSCKSLATCILGCTVLITVIELYKV